MTTATATGLPDDLESLPLPHLWKLFVKWVGESSRAPNKKYLARRIREAVAAQRAATPPPKLSTLTIDELRARYVEVVGRPTKSVDRGYLQWKIRQVQRGHIKAGPTTRAAKGSGVEHKVLPLRLEVEAAQGLDGAVERLGYTSRAAFLREAIASLLNARGEADVAALFASE